MANYNFLADPMRPSRLPVEGSLAETLDWIESAAQESKAFLTSQKGYEKIQTTMDRILAPDEPLRPEKLSRTSSNEFGKIATVLAALMTDVRPFWDYRTFNPQYQIHADISNRLAESWYLTRGIDQKNAAVAKYSLAAGTGYGHLVWNRDLQDLDLIPEDPRDVLPIRPSSVSASLQEAMGVMIVKELPVTRIEAMWPHVKGKINADRDGSSPSIFDRSTRVGKALARLNVSTFDLWRMFRSDPEKQSKGRYPVADLRTTYITDTSLNDTSSPREIGQFRVNDRGRRIPANNWSYVCEPGDPLYRTGKRLIISTKDTIIYDGPSWYWVPAFPICKLTPEAWPWTFLGKSPLWDIAPLQDSQDKINRHIDDKIALMMRPPVTADKNSVSASELRKFDPAQPAQKLHHAAIGAGIKIHDVPPIDPAVMNQRDWLQDRMYHLSGVQDVTQLMRLNQMPSDNTIETLLSAMSPDIRGRSRAIEGYMSELSQMLLYGFAQFYTLPRRLAVLGPQGQTLDDWDFDPDSFLPAYMPSDFDAAGRVKPSILDNPRPRFDRAKELERQLHFYVKPGSLLESASSTEKMMAIQLARMGYLDMWTLHERLGTQNLGEVPQGSIMDRLELQAQKLQGMAVGPAGASAAGRKASGQEPPSLGPNGVSESG